MQMRPMRKKLSDGIAKPKRLRNVPKYLYLRAKGFFTRLFYIISLVWKASPAVMIALCAFCLFDGLLPVVGAYISSGLLNEIANLIGVASTGSVLDDIFEVMSPLIFLFVLQFVHHFLKRLLSRLNTMVSTLAGELVVNYIKLMIIDKARRVDMRSFDSPEFYEKLENANREAGMRPIGILTASFSVISSVISVISFIFVLAMLSPIAPIIIIIASIPGAFVNYYYKNKNFHYMRFHSKERRQMNYYSSLMTSKDYAKEIKLQGLADTFTDKYKGAFGRYYKGLRSIITREGISQAAVSLLHVFAGTALFVFVAYTVVFGNGQIGDYSLYTGALTSISTYVTTIVGATATVYEGTLFIDNMIGFMNEPVTVVPTAKEPKTPLRNHSHTLELRGVSFRYPGSSVDVIKNISLTLKTNESVVLVGLNGAGKSTLIKLITRLYDPTEGEILLDGVDIREYDVEELYSIYGIIFQDFGKYADTVSENIRFGDVREDVSHEEVERAARDAGGEGFINDLPQQYETPLTRLFEENGIELSGGQWQKLSVARAFLKDSEILIMDEPTASLDPIAESEVMRRFEELSKNKLSVFVSHRLSGAVNAGKIVVLEDGTVVECGTHDELMSLGGKYYNLFSTQAKRYTE